MGLVKETFLIRVKSKASVTEKKYDRKCEYTYFSSHYHQNEQLSHISYLHSAKNANPLIYNSETR
jgi:hypothetical protein